MRNDTPQPRKRRLYRMTDFGPRPAPWYARLLHAVGLLRVRR
jgi:hypothetical protein